MRAALSCLGSSCLLVLLSALPASAQSADRFRALLAPHGTWVSVEGHGEAFVPHEASDESFVPYLSGGRWEARDAGLSFVSVYAWGEVCFHQGRWLRTDDTRTWVWLPGRAYASAWVSWRRRGDEVAWRALGPDDGLADRRAGASSWNVAPRAALGSALLATHALRVNDSAVAAFTDDASSLDASEGSTTASADDRESVPAPRVGRDQVLLSGGGRIVVHGPGGDRVLTTAPVVVSRATAEARRREQAERDEARRRREIEDREARARASAEQRERETLAAAERASRAADTATQAAVTATQAAQATTVTRAVPVWPYGGVGVYGGSYGVSSSAFGVGGVYGGYGAARRVERAPAPAPVTPAPVPATPTTPRIVGSARAARPR